MTTNNPPPITSPLWSSRTKRTVALICLVVIGIVVSQITGVVPLLVVSAVLSFLFNPLTSFLERRIFFMLPGSRIWAILLTFILALLFLLLMVLVIFPVLFSQLSDFASNLPAVLNNVQAQLQDWLSQPLTFRGDLIRINGDPLIPLDQINRVLGANGEPLQLQSLDIVGAVRSFVGSLTGPAFSVLGSAFQMLVNILFVLVLMFYLLKDGAQFAQRAVEITPEDYKNDVVRLLYELAQVWNAYLRGQLTLNVFIGVTTFIVVALLGLPNALILGLLAGLLEFVPNLGPILAMIPAALLALFNQSTTLPFLHGATFVLVVIVAYTLIQNFEAVVVVPRVMGGSLNLHPLVIIVGVLAGASLGGALGIILAAPLIASLRVIGQYIYGKLLDQPIFLDERPRQPRTGRWLGRAAAHPRLVRCCACVSRRGKIDSYRSGTF